ncbi:hypothetical protein ACSSS7_001644 [Eimeria intestinalis]
MALTLQSQPLIFWTCQAADKGNVQPKRLLCGQEVKCRRWRQYGSAADDELACGRVVAAAPMLRGSALPPPQAACVKKSCLIFSYMLSKSFIPQACTKQQQQWQQQPQQLQERLQQQVTGTVIAVPGRPSGSSVPQPHEDLTPSSVSIRQRCESRIHEEEGIRPTMISVTPQQQHSGPQCADVSAAAAAAAAAAVLGQTEEGRLGADLEGTQLLHFGCHCCNTVNIIVCVKTPDGSWLLRKAPAAAAEPVAADAEQAGIVITAPKTTPEAEGGAGVSTADAGRQAEEAAPQQEVSAKSTVQPAAARSGSTSSDGGSTHSEGSTSTIKRQCSEARPAASRKAAEESAAVVVQSAGAAAAAALAIAAPAAKRETAKATLVLRPLATNSTASTCSSLWETTDPRVPDEAPTPLDAPTPQRPSPKGGSKATAVQQRQQQHPKAQQKAGQARRKEAEQQEQEGSCSGGSESGKSTSSRAQQEQRRRGSSADKEAHEGERGPAPGEESATQQPQQEEEPEPEAELAEESLPSSGNSKTNDEDLSEMVANMVTRECEGDGNCLYRAFSDQLYGSQEHHLFLRKLAVEVMQRCQATFEAFIDESEGPFERWLQTKRTYGEWADYREMHALLLLFGAPIFVFDEHLQLLQTFEPEEEKRRLPSTSGETMTPFRLMWHGKLGHYTSLHYVKEGFPIARGLTIGELEAEGLARLILSEASGDSSPDAPEGGPKGPPQDGGDNEGLAECLQVSAQELAGIAAEQALILAAIKRQRVQQLLPQTTKVVDALWNEAKKEQEVWTARLARGPRGSAYSLPASAPGLAARQPSGPWRVIVKPAASSAAVTSPTATEGYAASVHVSGPPFRTIRAGSSVAPCSPSAVRFGTNGQGGHLGRYTAANQPAWQHQQQQVLVSSSPQVVRLSQGPPVPTTISTTLGSPPGPAVPPPPAYRQQYVTARDFSDQQRQPQCVRLADGRLVCMPPMEPLTPESLQQRQVELLQQQRRAAGRPAAAAVQQRQASSNGSKPAEEASWLSRWMGAGGASHGR